MHIYEKTHLMNIFFDNRKVKFRQDFATAGMYLYMMFLAQVHEGIRHNLK